MLTASVCTIGDEILIGQIVDTNSSHIARRLNNIGVKVNYMVSIADNHDEIVNNLRNCLEKSDIVIVTGGLGPTRDDITKPALRDLSGSDGYKYSLEQAAHVERILTSRGIPIIRTNHDQALVPDKCKVIENKLGTAPCMAFRFVDGKCPGYDEQLPEGRKSLLYSMPGVPFETLAMLGDVCDDICTNFTLDEVVHKTLVTFGIPESTLAARIEQWEDALPECLHLAYLPNATYGVRLRLSYYGAPDPDAMKMIEAEFEKLRPVLGDAIYGEGEDTLQSVIGPLLDGRTVCAAESCTGGHISQLFTSVPGCSVYYKGSVTSYANEIKINVLGVPAEVLKEYGAVSRECVEQMALGVRRLMNCDFSIATSGIAGPGGGSPEKPVGTCWMASAYLDKKSGEEKVVSRCVRFASNRATNIERFASYALDFLRQTILSN